MLEVSLVETRSPFMRRCPECGTELEDTVDFCPRDGHPLGSGGPDPYLGQVLLGQLEVEAVIGSGGMGTVYRARQREIDRFVAVKVLHPELRTPDVVYRFKREARLASRIDHPHLV